MGLNGPSPNSNNLPSEFGSQYNNAEDEVEDGSTHVTLWITGAILAELNGSIHKPAKHGWIAVDRAGAPLVHPRPCIVQRQLREARPIMMASWPMHLHQASFHAAGEARINSLLDSLAVWLSAKPFRTGTGCQRSWRPHPFVTGNFF